MKERTTKMIQKEYPKVSIGIPTYNSADRIRKTFNSIMDQDYPNLEVIISDNCSTDDTSKICSEMSQNQSQLTVNYFRQPHNIGLVPNFGFVLQQATGDYFMWIADDDTLTPGIITKYVDFLSNNPEYALVSGKIIYWLNNRPLSLERDFNIELNSPVIRVVQYYFRVTYGSMFYGLMPKKTAEKIPLRNRIGDDWHFVAALACLGKVKTLMYAGYNKKLGGISRNFKQYARVIGAGWFSEKFPHLKIAIDAFHEILFISPVYATLPLFKRIALAVSCITCIIFKHYCLDFPFILGGKVKRSFLKFNSSWKLKHLKVRDHTFF